MKFLRIVFLKIQKIGQGHHGKNEWYMLNISFDISDNQEMIGWILEQFGHVISPAGYKKDSCKAINFAAIHIHFNIFSGSALYLSAGDLLFIDGPQYLVATSYRWLHITLAFTQLK